jgi:hypothetical protein
MNSQEQCRILYISNSHIILANGFKQFKTHEASRSKLLWKFEFGKIMMDVSKLLKEAYWNLSHLIQRLMLHRCKKICFNLVDFNQ